MREICRGLKFPEGPVAMPDGSVILVEIERKTLTRVSVDGEVSVIADCGGGPNGAALGPDGKMYICKRWPGQKRLGPSFLITPGDSISNAHNRAALVSATYSFFSSADRPTPLGVSNG